ncbi:MAG: 30S ribosomal protein S10 [Candidatus Marsarchaeota archaeon]|jgi:SSU ribosomal protein S10P|nr:30S ribosomal protein S10 [Candidatus Marsarchaeota archaeon]
MGLATIKLVSTNIDSLNTIIKQIKLIADTINVKFKGPVPLPTKRIKHATRRTPCGDGSHTFEKWEMRFHKRIIQIDANEQALRQLMRIPVPDNVQIEIALG